MDNGKQPLMQIGALLLTAALVIGTIASGIALAVASLPAEFEEFAQRLAFVGPLGAALAVGLTAIGKGLYEIGKGSVPAGALEPLPDEIVPEDDEFAPIFPTFAEDAKGAAAEAHDAEGEQQGVQA